MPSLLALPKTVLDLSYKAAQISIGFGLDTIDRARTHFEGPPSAEHLSPTPPEDTGPDLAQARTDAKREAQRLERQAREGA
jgi:hypothetical protein